MKTKAHVTPLHATDASRRSIGLAIAQYGTAATLLWIGLFKFTPTEAEGIRSLVESSPLMSWMYRVGSVQAVSNFIGGFEITAALLLLAFPWFPRASYWGGILAMIIFTTTLSFMFTASGMFAVVDGLFVPTAAQFLLKDIAMLGVALVVVKESRSMLHLRKTKTL